MTINDQTRSIITRYTNLRNNMDKAIRLFEMQCPSINLRHKADTMDEMMAELTSGYHVSQMTFGQLRGNAAVIATAQAAIDQLEKYPS